MSAKFLKLFKEYFILTVACLSFAFAWEGFMIPNNMTSGGLMGACTVIQYATAGIIQASYSYVVINFILILLSVLAFGLGFGFKTLYCIGLTSVFLELVGNVEWLHAVPGAFFFIREPVLIPIVAGVLEAIGVGLMIRNGGSSGGTDIIVLIVNKYYPVSMARLFLLFDLMVISCLLFLPDKAFADMVYGYEMMLTFSMVFDVIIGGQRNSFQLMIFSDKYSEIADFVNEKMDRGATLLKAQGWYTKAEKNVLLVMISQKQLPMLSAAIKKIDSKAFMSVAKIGDVYGEGFEPIKGGIDRKIKKKNDR